ncbi:serine-threonine kinase receptor-associated protein [Tetranychus urticae]|uniref:Serine-threonine kinase receptor-associated protein n=1 Tax=Tetranychus urticae TaxID=32264 RepID=T1K495_TETUR|nr:serine-threonine kinase receptor-associated protein [Tetranychus urticae]XP_015782556.1 serine-threonine kinase receptor-associated protein [Tetranychus urticae]
MALKQHNLTCTGHTRPVVFLNFSGITDGKYYLISACKDGKPMLRQGETGDWIGTFEGHKGAVWGAALNVDASKAATGAADFSAKLWDAINGSELASLPHRHIVKSVSFSTDSSQLVTGSNEKLMRIFDLNRLDAEPLKINGHTSSIRHALFLNDDRWLISASDDKTIRLWDLKSLQEIQRLEFSSIPNDLELSADKNLLTVASANSVSFHEINGLNKIKEYQVPTIVYTASLSPDKAVFVCGGEDFTMYKYQFEDGTELDSFKGHFGPLHCIRFSPDGELYASASEDGTIRLWQTVIGKTYGLWRYEM